MRRRKPKGSQRDQRLQVCLTGAEHERLRELAKRAEMSMGALLRTAVDEFGELLAREGEATPARPGQRRTRTRRG